MKEDQISYFTYEKLGILKNKLRLPRANRGFWAKIPIGPFHMTLIQAMCLILLIYICTYKHMCISIYNVHIHINIHLIKWAVVKNLHTTINLFVRKSVRNLCNFTLVPLPSIIAQANWLYSEAGVIGIDFDDDFKKPALCHLYHNMKHNAHDSKVAFAEGY